MDNKIHYYLLKKLLVSDWLTANCEIVILTQRIFHINISKMTSKGQYEKIWRRLRHITMMTIIILTR
jgi:hypothetical protein